MIRLGKIAKPTILIQNEEGWTKALCDKVEAGEEVTKEEKRRYNHPQIKEALIHETNGKCAYCESKILHITFGDIEHICPKRSGVEYLFRWSNLTLACDKCNTYKGDREGIIDPYEENPDDYFLFVGPLLVSRPGNEKAHYSEAALKLNRAELVERRIDKIRYLSKQIEVMIKTNNPEYREILRQNIIENETAASQEFSAVAREFISAVVPVAND